MSCSPGGGGPTACESNVPARTAFSRARHLTNREGTMNGEPEMNPINAPATAGEPSTRSARAAQNGAPPTRGGAPSTRSRERFPTTASAGTRRA